MQAADFDGAYGIVTVLETCIALCYSVRYYGSATARGHVCHARSWFRSRETAVGRCTTPPKVQICYGNGYRHTVHPETVQRRFFTCSVVHCQGLHVDKGEFKPVGQKVDREQRFCLGCASDMTEDEHHSVFDCPAYCSIRHRYTATFWGPAPTLSAFFTLQDPRVIAEFLHECFFLHTGLGC